jgi:hypothetical protein
MCFDVLRWVTRHAHTHTNIQACIETVYMYTHIQIACTHHHHPCNVFMCTHIHITCTHHHPCMCFVVQGYVHMHMFSVALTLRVSVIIIERCRHMSLPYTCTCIHALVHMRMHIHTQGFLHARILSIANAIYMCMRIYPYTYSHIFKNACTHRIYLTLRLYACIHKYAYTYIIHTYLHMMQRDGTYRLQSLQSLEPLLILLKHLLLLLNSLYIQNRAHRAARTVQRTHVSMQDKC